MQDFTEKGVNDWIQRSNNFFIKDDFDRATTLLLDCIPSVIFQDYQKWEKFVYTNGQIMKIF